MPIVMDACNVKGSTPLSNPSVCQKTFAAKLLAAVLMDYAWKGIEHQMDPSSFISGISISLLTTQPFVFFLLVTANMSAMETVAEWSWRTYPAPLGAGGVGSIPANPDAQNVPSFRRRRFEMKLSPFLDLKLNRFQAIKDMKIPGIN